jgi:protocatechuate 3,4-dioxygenase beta subunit
MGASHHPRGAGTGLDPGFQGFGMARTDAQGGFRFLTIRPVPYPGRTPHIHLKVRHPGFDELTSQWFVAGDPGNARDVLFRRLTPAQRDQVTMTLERPPAGTGLAWHTRRDIVVPA